MWIQVADRPNSNSFALRIGWLVAIFFLFMSSAALAKLIGTVYNFSEDPSGNILVVDKSRQVLYVVQCPPQESPRIITTFRITTGRINGNKESEGDLKTPEGIYYVHNRIPGAKLPEKFGPLALVLDYPNYVDRLRKRTGSNIWIHGRDQEIKDRQTEGCISLENSHILDLEPYIKMYRTPVVILDTLEFIEASAYQHRKEEWRDFLQKWADAWEAGNMQRYLASYAPEFRDNSSPDLDAFTRRKKYLDSIYPWKKVDIDEISVVSAEEETHLRFRQKYCCPNFYTEGTKELILIAQSPTWKIVTEKYHARKPRQEMKTILHSFLKEWENSWESRDITQYIQNYHPDFATDQLNLDGWRQDKGRKFSDTDKIQISIDDIRLHSTESLTWELRFRQEYRSDSYHDVGIKTLTVRGYPPDLKITREEWRPLP